MDINCRYTYGKDVFGTLRASVSVVGIGYYEGISSSTIIKVVKVRKAWVIHL